GQQPCQQEGNAGLRIEQWQQYSHHGVQIAITSEGDRSYQFFQGKMSVQLVYAEEQAGIQVRKPPQRLQSALRSCWCCGSVSIHVQQCVRRMLRRHVTDMTFS